MATYGRPPIKIKEGYVMFDEKRLAPWDGIGRSVHGARNSKEVMKLAGLDWTVRSEDVYLENGLVVPGVKATVRSNDDKVLGIVGSNYKVVQNSEAFSFMDQVLGEGVTYETAGALLGGKRVWVLAHVPGEYKFLDDNADPYILFSTSHNGTGAIRICLTPIRVVCMNTLNLAIKKASRSWSIIHKGLMEEKIANARDTLVASKTYMGALCEEMIELNKIKLTDAQVDDYVKKLIPMPAAPSTMTKRNVTKKRLELIDRYQLAPDLAHVDKSAFRLVNAVSDFATHSDPLRMRKNYRDTRLLSIMDGNDLIDRSYQMMKEAV